MTNAGRALTLLSGRWTGTNRMRLMPEDAYTESPSSAEVRAAARSRFFTLSYTWQADDTAQDGFLLVGDGHEPGTVLAVWCDSWHQSPQWMTCRGTVTAAGAVTVAGSYGSPSDHAGWRIGLDPGDGTTLRITMHNVVPDADYQVVEATYRRAS